MENRNNNSFNDGQIPAESHKIETPVLPSTTNREKLLTPKEVSEWLNLSQSWVRDHATRKQPRIKSLKIGKLLRFREVDVEEFIAKWAA